MLCLLLFSVNTRVVYFTAGTVEVIDKNWKEGEIIIFLHVISNVGEAYNASNGVFTAPHSGVYVFTFFLADPFAGGFRETWLSMDLLKLEPYFCKVQVVFAPLWVTPLFSR